MSSGILYIAMNLLHLILHCQTPNLCLSLVVAAQLSLGVSLSVEVSLPSAPSIQEEERLLWNINHNRFDSHATNIRKGRNWIKGVPCHSWKQQPFGFNELWLLSAKSQVGGACGWRCPQFFEFIEEMGRNKAPQHHNALQPVWQHFLWPTLLGYCEPVQGSQCVCPCTSSVSTH